MPQAERHQMVASGAKAQVLLAFDVAAKAATHKDCFKRSF
jgi:hypothetical protein